MSKYLLLKDGRLAVLYSSFTDANGRATHHREMVVIHGPQHSRMPSEDARDILEGAVSIDREAFRWNFYNAGLGVRFKINPINPRTLIEAKPQEKDNAD